MTSFVSEDPLIEPVIDFFFIKVPNHHIFDFSGLLKFRSQSMQLPKQMAEGFQVGLSNTSVSDSVLTSTPV